MSGTIKGVVDVFISGATAAQQNNTLFTTLYNYFQLHVGIGQAALHASNFGLAGTGFDFFDEANPSGENAFAVFRFLGSASTRRTNDYYIMIQWADAQPFGNAPGNPGSIDNATGDGVGIVMAWREGGGDPWNGTTNADGTDTKGSPVWAGADVHVFDTTNETGARSTLKEDFRRIVDTSTNNMRWHHVGDADCHFIYIDTVDDADSDSVVVLGAYEPKGDLSIADPLFFYRQLASSLPPVTTIFDFEGLLAGEDPTDGVRSYSHAYLIEGLHNQTYAQPAQHGATPATYSTMPMYLVQRSGAGTGHLGNWPPEVVDLVYNAPGNTANAALDRAYLPTAVTQATMKYSCAWGGSGPPGTNMTKQGVTF